MGYNIKSCKITIIKNSKVVCFTPVCNISNEVFCYYPVDNSERYLTNLTDMQLDVFLIQIY